MKKIRVNNTDFIKKLSEDSGYYQYQIKNLLNILDKTLCDMLCEATEDEQVEVRITPSISVVCKYQGPMKRKDWGTGEYFIEDPKYVAVGKIYGFLKNPKKE